MLGTITVQNGGATGTLPFEVVDAIAKIAPSTPSVEVRAGETRLMTVKAYDSKNREVIFDPHSSNGRHLHLSER